MPHNLETIPQNNSPHLSDFQPQVNCKWNWRWTNISTRCLPRKPCWFWSICSTDTVLNVFLPTKPINMRRVWAIDPYSSFQTKQQRKHEAVSECRNAAQVKPPTTVLGWVFRKNSSAISIQAFVAAMSCIGVRPLGLASSAQKRLEAGPWLLNQKGKPTIIVQDKWNLPRCLSISIQTWRKIGRQRRNEVWRPELIVP